MAKDDKGPNGPHEDKNIVIHIDHKQYKTTKTHLTGTELRALAEPQISGDYDLWMDVPGPSDDQKIEDGQTVELRNGMHFYSVPRQINPGCDYGVT
jgi:Multiubiquitin